MTKIKRNYKSLFLERTIELLQNKSKHITYSLIQEETGLTKYWLDSLIQQHNKFDPGIRKIETLYNYLSEKPFSFDCVLDELSSNPK